MFMGIGDVKYDSAPLQVTQFEADIRIAEAQQRFILRKVVVEITVKVIHYHGGSQQCILNVIIMLKEVKKDYLFTIGDECPPKDLS